MYPACPSRGVMPVAHSYVITIAAPVDRLDRSPHQGVQEVSKVTKARFGLVYNTNFLHPLATTLVRHAVHETRAPVSSFIGGPPFGAKRLSIREK